MRNWEKLVIRLRLILLLLFVQATKIITSKIDA